MYFSGGRQHAQNTPGQVIGLKVRFAEDSSWRRRKQDRRISFLLHRPSDRQAGADGRRRRPRIAGYMAISASGRSADVQCPERIGFSRSMASFRFSIAAPAVYSRFSAIQRESGLQPKSPAPAAGTWFRARRATRDGSRGLFRKYPFDFRSAAPQVEAVRQAAAPNPATVIRRARNFARKRRNTAKLPIARFGVLLLNGERAGFGLDKNHRTICWRFPRAIEPRGQ